MKKLSKLLKLLTAAIMLANLILTIISENELNSLIQSGKHIYPIIMFIGTIVLIYFIFSTHLENKKLEKQLKLNQNDFENCNEQLKLKSNNLELSKFILSKIKEERYYRGGLINYDIINSDKSLFIKEIIKEYSITENEAEKIIESYMGFDNTQII